MHEKICRRCGTCCKKGGPSFHHEDRPLIENGIILLKHLYTIRRGEQVYDNVKGCPQTAEADIIKLKEKPGTRACIFFDEKENGCQFYEHRPLECKSLNCQDTREIASVYDKKRLTRKDVVGNISGLWDLIESHQLKCDYEKLGEFVRDWQETGNNDVHQNIAEMLRYDMELRSLVVEKGGMDAEITDFLFGKPIMETIQRLGVKIRKKDNHTFLISYPG